MYFCYFVIISSSNRAGLSFEETWVPFTQGCFEPKLVEIDPVILEKKMKMGKIYNDIDANDDNVDDDDDDDDGQRTNFDQKSSLELWAQVN